MLLGCSQEGEVQQSDTGRNRNPLNGDWRNGDNLEEQLIRQINAAKEEVLIAIQELTLPKIAKPLIRAKQQEVRVEVVLENNYSKPWSRQHPSDLSAQSRRRQQRLQLLADSNRDGRLTSEERLAGDAIALLKSAGYR